MSSGSRKSCEAFALELDWRMERVDVMDAVEEDCFGRDKLTKC